MTCFVTCYWNGMREFSKPVPVGNIMIGNHTSKILYYLKQYVELPRIIYLYSLHIPSVQKIMVVCYQENDIQNCWER